MAELLKRKALNQWHLFWLISAPITVAVLVTMAGTDMSSASGVSSMIQMAVRCAVPLLYVTFAASAFRVLFPGPVGHWLVRNRKYLGLSFAAAMAWQGFFILWMVTVHTAYYVNEVYVLRDAIEGVGGYFFLILMTITSFRPGRSLLSQKQWRVLHTVGIYFLWAYAFGVYWWALFYYTNPIWLDYVYYWTGFAAWALRAAAWSKKRHQSGSVEPNDVPVTAQLAGGLIIGLGLFAASFGGTWMTTAYKYLMGYELTRLPELYMPYWPFVSYLPLFVIALGVWIISRSRQGQSPLHTIAARSA